MSYGFTTCDETYRNGGTIPEVSEPHSYDTVDWFNRAERDPRVVSNQLTEMRIPVQNGYEQ
jgi:hypothetical protein